MDLQYQVNKRKACDLCFHKKIRCDMLKPSCSNCKLYRADCRTTRVRRRVKHGKAVATPSDSGNTLPHAEQLDATTLSSDSRINEVESRLARVEQHVEQVLGGTPWLNLMNLTEPTEYLPQQYQPIQKLPDFDNILLSNVNGLTSQQSLGLKDMSQSPEVLPPLPPLLQVHSPIMDFFKNINSVLPLFSEKTLWEMLHGYYSCIPQYYTRGTWAAANVVLALATITTNRTDNPDVGSEYINNAQSLLPELLARDPEIIDLQVVLGLVIVFQMLRDSRPAVVLVGMAVRLAHQLRIHLSQTYHDIPQDQQREYQRIFWIAYLLDRDICLRYHTPATQAEDDFDVDFPPSASDTGYIYAFSQHGDCVCFDYFRHRLRLAIIQGRVYNMLFGARASKICFAERQSRVLLLHNELETWRQAIPAEFQADLFLEYAGREGSGLFWLSLMHFSYLGCLVMVHGIWSHDTQWRQRLLTSVIEGNNSLDSFNVLPASLPKGWRVCVEMSRHCMRIMQKMPLGSCSEWANGCAYFSGMLIILANIFDEPRGGNVGMDLKLVGYAVEILNQMSNVSALMALKRMNIAASELYHRAKLTVATAASEGMGDDYQSSSELTLWKWGQKGVDGWPGMDFALTSTSASMV